MRYKTRALTITVRPDDIVEIITNDDWREPDTLEIAKENIEAMQKAVNGKPRALLSETPNTHLSKEVLKYYSEAKVGEIATVMLTTSFGSKVIGNLFLKLTGKNRGKAPIRIVSMKDRDEGIKWLLERIAEAKKKSKSS